MYKRCYIKRVQLITYIALGVCVGGAIGLHARHAAIGLAVCARGIARARPGGAYGAYLLSCQDIRKATKSVQNASHDHVRAVMIMHKAIVVLFDPAHDVVMGPAAWCIRFQG